MSEFRRWMRKVLPPRWVTLLALVLNYGSRAMLEVLTWMTRPASASDLSFLHLMVESEPTQRAFATMPCFAAVMYGMWRALGRHPVTRPRYREWLLQTPWRWTGSLPIGPVLPAWQDLIALSVLTIPAIGWPVLPLYVPTTLAIVAYGATSHLLSLNRRPGIEFLAGVWALASMLYFRETPAATVIAAIVLLIAAWRATILSLSELHQQGEWFGGWFAPLTIELQGPLGWPYDALAPHSLQKHSAGIRLLIPLTLGLALAAIRPQLDILASEVECFVVLFGAAIAIVRYVVYSTVAWAGLTIARRICFGRLVSPRADSLALSTLAIALAGYLLPTVVLQLPTTGTNQFALAASFLIALAFFLPPSRETWRLTSAARLVRQKTRSNKYRRLRHSTA